MINETKVGEDLIRGIVGQQHQILVSQENIHKTRRTKIFDLKRYSIKNMKYIENRVQNIKKTCAKSIAEREATYDKKRKHKNLGFHNCTTI